MAESEHATEILELKELLEAEWQDRLSALWASGTPLALDGDEGGGDNGDEGSTDAGDDDDDGDDDGDEGKTPEQIAIDKAHAKLRAAEARERKATAELTKLQRQGLSEAETAKAERDDARAEAAALQERLDEIEQTGTVREIAKGLKFKNPDGAVRFIHGKMEEADIKKELKQVLKDFPELASEGAPPPPVDDKKGKDSGSSNNERMNKTIRQAAGRG